MVPRGLSSEAAAAAQKSYGYNEIVEQKPSLLRKIITHTASPISAMLLVAAVLSYASGKAFDGSFILALLALNIVVTVWQEHKADTAIEKLNEHLATLVRVNRDGTWQQLSARLLVPHDIVELSAGAIVPADAKLLEAHSVSANEAALTGESLPKEKSVGDELYSGSFLASGLATVEVTATGNKTFFGKTIAKIDAEPKKSTLEKDILRISRFLSILSLVAVVILTAALLLNNASWLEVLRLDLSLIIAGIPISLPTVMTLIIAFGVIALAKKGVVVRRLSSLEELANADLLLTDKTGTLTKNHIIVNEVLAYGTVKKEEVERLAALVAANDADTTINQALLAKGAPIVPEGVSYVPADSSRKRSTLTFSDNGEEKTLSLGAPQIIESLCDLSGNEREKFEKDIADLANRGYRALALAQVPGKEEKHMTLLGVFALSDELREDAGPVVQFLKDNGIETVMVTGDNRAIAREISDTLKIPGTHVVARDELLKNGWDSISAQTFHDAQAFAEILPEDKYELVNHAKPFYTVATNGDGVNDLPALKAANVSFAVKNAVDALRGSADIVLLSDGIGVMRDAFIEGRKIFERLYTYSLYRISESFRLIVTIAILGVATGVYPLSPLQLILIALLNDIPIISLAFDRVRIANRPSKINVKKQFSQSLLYGAVGVVNSLLLYFLALHYFHLPFPVVETLFFLKLTVSGHMLIYVVHTKARWWRFLPSRSVIIATSLTQVVATILALTGFLMPAAVSWPFVAFIWLWSFFFMQVSEVVKVFGKSKAPQKI